MEKIKTLHLFDEYLPPSQIWAYHLLTNLPDVEIHIAAKYYWRNNFYPSTFKFTEPLNFNLNKYNEKIRKSLEGRLFSKYAHLSKFFERKVKDYLCEYIKDNEINLIHAHFGTVGWEFLKIVKGLKIPYVVSFYGYDYDKVPYLFPKYNRYYRQLFEEAQFFICEGPFGAKKLIEKGCKKGKVGIVPLGVDFSLFPFYERNKEENSLRLIQIASFTEKKGHIYSVEAFSGALSECPNLELIIIGGERESSIKNEVVSFINRKKLFDKIKILDFISYQDLSKFLKNSDVFIHPSCHSRDFDSEGGAPVILIEAHGYGLPIITTDHCDIPEIVQNAKSGIIVPERDVNGLIEAIKFFYFLSPQRYHSMSKAARTHVEKQYDVKKSASILHDYYLKIIQF